ncbi:MAG: hypothetical protein CVU90_05145 [Firmicutes bacterium HGW-Firmicutes-15]|nr:MAG: hypothetical protein CVU90_05145 [Firmicutes bacterium HGW-Firmicutes-15]
MNSSEQKKVFWKIVLASIKNIIGFGLATAFIGYLATRTSIDTPLMILAVVVVFLIFVSLSTLLVYIFFTVKGIPANIANKPKHMSFSDLYAYTLIAISVRIVEAVICIAYIIYLSRIFTK